MFQLEESVMRDENEGIKVIEKKLEKGQAFWGKEFKWKFILTDKN